MYRYQLNGEKQILGNTIEINRKKKLRPKSNIKRGLKERRKVSKKHTNIRYNNNNATKTFPNEK